MGVACECGVGLNHVCAKYCSPNAAVNIRIHFEPMSLHFPDPPPAPPPSLLLLLSSYFQLFLKKTAPNDP